MSDAANAALRIGTYASKAKRKTTTNAHLRRDEIEIAEGCILAWKTEHGFGCTHTGNANILNRGWLHWRTWGMQAGNWGTALEVAPV